MVLKEEKPYTERPNAHLEPIDFDEEMESFKREFDSEKTILDLISYKLYPKVYRDYHEHFEMYGEVRRLPTPAFFFGLEPNEEIIVSLSKGKNVLVKYLNKTMPDEQGMCLVFFELNGQTRSVQVLDRSLQVERMVNRKATSENEVGAPLQGSISKILVEEGEQVEAGAPLFIIEAMKMESTITAPMAGRVHKVYLTPKTMVTQDDLVVELEPANP
jgi:pyruvate carboxylase